MDKSFSESNLNDTKTYEDKTPPTFVSQRVKRRREEDCIFDSLKNDIKELSSLLFAQNTELQAIKSTLKDIKQTNTNIEKTMEFLTQKNEELQNKINLLEIQSKKDRECITLLEDKIEDMQRNNRKTCLEIKNVPKINNETRQDLMDMVINLTESIKCKIENSDIKDIYRVQGKKDKNKNTPIIIETSSTIIKTDILKACKNFNIKNKEKLRAKDLGFKTEENTPIYVSEQLTARAARLFFLARDLSSSKQYRFCWTSFGKIYVRKDETSPVIRINNESQINQLMQKT